MGKRNFHDRKIGRHLNPADQARKNARRKELKKNKKHRSIIRENLLKTKDPRSIYDELYQLDEQEINNISAPVIEESLFKEKRKKLKMTLEKLNQFYKQRDDKKTIEEIKSINNEYEHKKKNLWRAFYAKKQEEDLLNCADPEKLLLQCIPFPEEDDGEIINSETDSEESDSSEYDDFGTNIQILPTGIPPPGPPSSQPPENARKIPEDFFAPDNIDDMKTTGSLKSNVENEKNLPDLYINPFFMNYQNYVESMETGISPPPPRMNHPFNLQRQSLNIPDYYMDHYDRSYPDVGYPQAIENGTDLSSLQSTISATPQLRDIQAEITRLVPVSVIRKREQQATNPNLFKNEKSFSLTSRNICPNPTDIPSFLANKQNEDPYENFMREINKFT